MSERVVEYNGIIIDYSRDADIPEQGLAMLTRKGFYKKDYENSPQESFARAAVCYCFGDYELAQRLYDAVSKGWFTFASPVLSNAVDITWPNFDKHQFHEASDWLEDNVDAEGMPISCFAAGTPVFTDKGLVDIEKLVVGDKVLTHKGRFRSVTATKESSSSDIYDLKLFKANTMVTVTGNHRVLTNSGWKRVDSLVKGLDYVAVNNTVDYPTINKPSIEIEDSRKHSENYNEGTYKAVSISSPVITKDLAWALGLWFAEGSTTNNGAVRVTNGDLEPCTKWAKIMGESFGLKGVTTSPAGRNWHTGEVYSVVLQRNFDMLFGKGCKVKKLNDQLMGLSEELFEEFLTGFYLGDGYKTVTLNTFELTNVVLVSQIVLLLMKYGYDTSHQFKKYIRFNRNRGNGVYNGVASYCKEREKHKTSIRRGISMPDGLSYAPIHSLVKVETNEIPVFDIQVEEDESFSAAGIVAHNCFLALIPDTKEGLVRTRQETAWLSMMGGGTSVFASNRSPDEKSTGVMAHLRGYDADTLAYKQCSTRRGSMAAYLDINHPEIKSFIAMRNPVGGDQNKKCFNLNNGVMLTDSFMEAVVAGDDYELVDPKHGATGTFLNARTVWEELLTLRFETGEPYLVWKDTINSNLPSQIRHPLYQVSQSNLCSEITLMTSDKRTAVCCLSSLNLEKYDEWKDEGLVGDLLRLLDNVLEYFIRLAPNTLERAIRSAKKERAIGIGTLGWHSYLQKNMIPFESGGLNSAAQHTNIIYSKIKSEADKESKSLAKYRGEAPDVAGSGYRNSHFMAIAPNASSSSLVGSSPSVEPFAAVAYVAQGRAGSFLIKNKYFSEVLSKCGKDSKTTWDSIIENKGSVQHLEFLTENEKKVFKTAREINPQWIIELASIRQKHICQSQSINLFVNSDITLQEMSDIHMMAWKKGLKSLYYCRAESAGKVSVGTGGDKPLNSIPVQQKIDFEVCLSCEG